MREGYCKQSVYNQDAWRGFQCSRKVWKDGYCKQHHPDNVEERRKKSLIAYEAKLKQTPWYHLSVMNKRWDKLYGLVDPQIQKLMDGIKEQPNE